MEAPRFKRSSGLNNTNTSVNYKNLHPAVTSPSPTVESVKEIAIKSAVKRLISANSAFRTWLHRLITTMPQAVEVPATADAAPDPTPAEAHMASQSRKSRKVANPTASKSGKQPANKNSKQHVSSPIRPLGSKRRQNQSPQSSPTKSALSGVNTANDDVDISLTPLKLEEKLELLKDKADLTQYQALHIVQDRDWKGELFNHKDLELVLESEKSLWAGDVNYVFTKQGELDSVNLDLIKREMCKRASKCREPESSKYHFNHGPFYIKCDQEHIGVYNSDEKEVVILPFSYYGLPTGEFRFALNDSFTHEVLCSINLGRLVSKLTAMKSSAAPIALLVDPANAPFRFEKVSASQITLSSSLGVVATMDISDLTSSPPKATDPNAQSATAAKPKIRFGTTEERQYNKSDTPAAASSNPFSPLSTDDAKTDDAKVPKAVDPKVKPTKGSATPKPTTKSKTVDEMSEAEFEDVLSTASQESAQPRRQRRRRRSRRKKRSVKSQDNAEESWMEPTGYDSNEDSDYTAEGDGADGKSDDSGSYATDGSSSGNSDATSDLSDMETDGDLKQVEPELGQEGIRISAKSFSNTESPAPSSSAAGQGDDVEPVPFGSSSDKVEWVDDSSAASSSDTEVKRGNLVDRVPLTPFKQSGDTATTDMSTITGVTDPSEIFPRDEGKYLLSFNISLQPNQQHKEVLIKKTRKIFDYMKSLASDLALLPATQANDGSALPPVLDSSDSHFPSNYGEFRQYGKISNGWVLSKEPVDAQTLANRRAFKANKKAPQSGSKKKANLRKKAKAGADDNGPTEMYVNMSFATKHHDLEDLTQSLNIDLGPEEGIYATLKTVQCWKSDPRYILVCVSNLLCTEGVKSTLRQTFKEIRQKLCRRGRLDTLVWYDHPIPDFHVYSRKMRPLRGIPEAERAELAFDPYPGHTQFAFYVEASSEAWNELDPLIDVFIDSNQICKAFGPNAFFLRNPDGVRNPNLDTIREYQSAARKHMGYQLLTTPYSCAHVNVWEHPVRVKMAEIDEVDSSGSSTGRKITPPPPYRRTSLRQELQDITINGKQVFHTAIVTEKGSDVGYSQVVVSVDPSNPYTPANRTFATNTLAHFPGFLHHYLRKVKGFHESTVKRLENCLYIDSAALGEHYSWDQATMRASPAIATRKDRWHLDSSHLDIKKKSVTPKPGSSGPAFLGNSPVELTDDVKQDLLRKLRVDADKLGPEAGKEGASVLSGGTDGTGGTSVNMDNMARKSHDLALKLAKEAREKAELAAELARLKATIQQGAPHHSGSDVPPSEVDRGGGMSQG